MMANLLNEKQILDVLSFSENAISVFTGEDVTIEYANKTVLKFWGKDESVIGLPLGVAVPELKNQPFEKMLRQVFITGVDNTGKAIKAALPVDGIMQTFYFDYDYKAIKDETGKTYSVLSTAQDVTEDVINKQALQKAKEHEDALYREQALSSKLARANEKLLNANRALRQSEVKLRKLNNELEERVESRTRAVLESEARFRAMAEGSDILIVVADETSKAIYFNKAWERLTGKSAQNLLGSGWVDLVHPEDKDRYVATYLTALKDKVPFEGEFRVKGKDGEYHWLLTKVPPHFRPDGTFAGYIGSCVDITSLKEAELRKDDFISIASHELKTPLTSLQASLQLMNEVKDDPSPKLLHKLIKQSNVSMRKITVLVDDLLNANRANEGQLHINKVNFKISHILGTCCNEIRAGGNHHLVVDSDKKLEVYGDENRIEQVVVNMVNNAAKYAPGSRNIYLIAKKIGDMAKISIKDNGPGIDPERIPYLFDRYYRADYAGNQYSGLGLGLYISAEIIKRHGGEIGVESELGKGSTFWFTLPVA